MTEVQRTAFICNLGTPADLVEAQARATASVNNAIAAGFFPELLEVLPDVTADGVPLDGLVLLAAKSGEQSWAITNASLRLLLATPSTLNSVVYAEGVTQAAGLTPSLRSIGWMALPIGGVATDLLVLLYTDGAPSASPGPVVPVVPSTTINDTGLSDGEFIIVDPYKQPFQIVKSGPGATSALVPDVVMSLTSGVGRAIRQLVPVPRWTKQTTYFMNSNVNALLPAGSDLNDGTAGFPVRTISELTRRLQACDAGLYTVNAVDTVEAADLAAARFAPRVTDQGLAGFVTSLQEQVLLLIKGPDVTASAGTGTLSGAVASVPGTSNVPVNTQQTITDAVGALATATAGQMVELTSGASVGARAKLLASLGGGSWQTGEFFFPLTGVLSTAPAIGNTYKILALPLFNAPVLSTGMVPRVAIAVQNMKISSPSPGVVLTGGQFEFLGCDLTVGLQPPPQNFPFEVFLRGCGIQLAALGNFCQSMVGQGPIFQGCHFLNCRVQVRASVAQPLTDCTFRNSTVRTVDAGRIQGGDFDLQGKIGFFSVPTGESAITLRRGARMQLRSGSVLYGTGAVVGSRYGIECRDGGKFFFDSAVSTAIPITNTLGSISLDGLATALPPLEASAGLPLPALAALTTIPQLLGAPFNGQATNTGSLSQFAQTAG